MHRRPRSLLSGRLLAAVVASMVLVGIAGLPSPAGAETCEPEGFVPTFTDIPAAHPFCLEIEGAVDAELIGGYADGTFRPNAFITRQAVAAMITRLALSGEPPVGCAGAPATDVPMTHPFCAEIQFAMSGDTMTGYADGTFRPGNFITRQAAAAVFARMYPGLDPIPDCTSEPFSDVPTTHPFCAEIAAMADAGIVGGYADGTFRPGAQISRQAFAAMLYRMYLVWEPI